MEKKQERLYKPSEVSKTLGISTDLLRKWVEDFNVQAAEITDGGHRRYSKENVAELIAINKKIKEQNWSWDQVRSWRNGEEEIFANHEEQSKLDKKMDQILSYLEEQKEANKTQMEFNQVLVQKLAAMEQENQNLRNYIQTQLPNRLEIEERDQKLLEDMRRSQEEKQEKKSWIQRLLPSKS